MDESGPDKRLAWIGARVCTTLRVKEDVWKAISNSESKYVELSTLICNPNTLPNIAFTKAVDTARIFTP